VHITGTAYRGAWGVSQGVDPTTFVVAANAPLQIGTEVLDPSANLTQDTDGTVNVDSTFDDSYRRWTRIRPYLTAVWDNGSPNTLVAIEMVTAVDDPDQPEWTEVV
jgi:hypothetical protein